VPYSFYRQQPRRASFSGLIEEKQRVSDITAAAVHRRLYKVEPPEMTECGVNKLVLGFGFARVRHPLEAEPIIGKCFLKVR
jgi:hypothetical protein